MILTPEQVQAVRDGGSVTISDPDVGAECVVVRADVFARVKQLIYDDSDFDPAGSMINELMQDDDARDPWLASYQNP